MLGAVEIEMLLGRLSLGKLLGAVDDLRLPLWLDQIVLLGLLNGVRFANDL